MIVVRASGERGYFNHGWLETYHTFSFADYRDREHVRFRTLRVINEDRVAPGQGFGMHDHHDMEILTYVLSGSLAHTDSLGNASVIEAGEVQRMTAGTGISHSEFNPSEIDPVHLLQIWIFPEQKGLTPGYEQRKFDAAGRQNRWQLIASREARDGSVLIHQDADVLLGGIEPESTLHYGFRPERFGWLQVTRGQIHLNDRPLTAGDGAAISEEPEIVIRSDAPAEVLLFDLA